MYKGISEAAFEKKLLKIFYCILIFTCMGLFAFHADRISSAFVNTTCCVDDEDDEDSDGQVEIYLVNHSL